MQTQPHAEQFLGSWALVSAQNIQPSGEILLPFGDHPSGLLVYQPDGTMSAQLSVGSPSRLLSDNFTLATDEEAATTWHEYFGYWGTFKIDANQRIVVHHVEGSCFANWIGTDQVRNFRFDERGHLVLETQTPIGLYSLTWCRKST